MTLGTPIEAAQKRLKEMKDAGFRPMRPARLPALKAYFRDFFGVNDNKLATGEPTRCMAEYQAHMRTLRGQSLRKVVEAICFECVGGDDDPGPKIRVKNCLCTDCPLHPVRPWTRLKGRGVAAGRPHKSILGPLSAD